jgi:hypothetical protein
MRHVRLFKKWCDCLMLAAVLLAAMGAAAPAHAQIIKPQGLTLPGFLFTPAERRAREACIEERPECRATVRAEIEQEMAISLTLPWILLAACVLGVLFWLRGQEKKKAAVRAAARRNHDPGAFRKLDREKSDRKKNGDADEEDRDNLD